MFKDKLIFDVTEDPKLGQLKDLGEASDELVEIRNTAVEVLEHSESEEEDSALEKVDQGEVGLETTRMHRPDAPQVRAVHTQDHWGAFKSVHEHSRPPMSTQY